LGIGDCTSAPLCYQGLGIGDGINLLITHYSLLITHYSLLLTPYYWGLGIALRLRSVTRDWGLGMGLIYSLLITHYSLLLTPYYWGLGIALRLRSVTRDCGWGWD
jgi:hypothetical protein